VWYQNEPPAPITQEYTIKEADHNSVCGFHDGYDRDCFEKAVFNLDLVPMCLKHLHVRMRHITLLTLKSKDRFVLTYRIR
jgi:hypothetical protein